MRASTASILAGMALILAGAAGSSLAAEDNGRDTPSAEVAPAGAPSDQAGAESEEAGQGGAAAIDEDGRLAPEVETVAVGEKGEKDDSSEDERDRGKKEREKGAKQPLADESVKIKDFTYKPDPITVTVGDEITWTNRDTAQHTATAEGKGDFDTGLLAKGETGTIPFNDAGTFDYICTVHPSMTGEVVVRSASSSGGGGTSTSGGSTSSSSDAFSPTTPSADSGLSGGSGSSSGGTLPNTGQSELPLLLLGTGLIVFGLLARAFHEHWLWR